MEVSGRNPKTTGIPNHPFPQSIPPLGDEKASTLAARSSGFPNFIFSLCARNRAIIWSKKLQLPTDIYLKKSKARDLSNKLESNSENYANMLPYSSSIRGSARALHASFEATVQLKKKTPPAEWQSLLPVPDSNLAVTQSLRGAFCVQTSPSHSLQPWSLWSAFRLS